MKNNEIKDFYKSYADKIQHKRTHSPYRIRQYVHKMTHQTVLRYIKKGERVLEVGCGEGVLAVMMAKKGADVVAVDLSEKNLEAAQKLAKEEGVNIRFQLADAENLPFDDNSFEVIVADNVLEHLPDFKKGLTEIKRVMSGKSIIALPTCFNPCAWGLLGRDVYWKITRRTPYAMLIGLSKVFRGIILGQNGIDEGYGGKKGLPHLLRYPWKMREELRQSGLKINSFEAATICFPYLSFLLPITRFLDKYKNRRILRDLGLGAVAVLKKV